MEKKTKFSQASMPQFTLREALELSQSLNDNFAGKEATPIDLAKSIGQSPTSSKWRMLTSASVAYGLTIGTFSAHTIDLAPLGRKIVAPTEEGEDGAALLSALMQPTIMKAFYEKYDGNKLPKEDIVKNVLSSQMGVPQDRLDSAFRIIVENAQFVGILSNVNGSLYIQLRSARPQTVSSSTASQTANVGQVQQQETASVRNSSENAGDLVLVPIIEGELGIAVSRSLQSKTWLNNRLAEKMAALTNAARDFATEWNKQNSGDENAGG